MPREAQVDTKHMTNLEDICNILELQNVPMDHLMADQVHSLSTFTVSSLAKTNSVMFAELYAKRIEVYTNLARVKSKNHLDNPLVLEAFV